MSDKLKRRWIAIIGVLCAAAVIVAAGVGSVNIPVAETVRILLKFFFKAHVETDATFETILLNIRLHRVLLAFICGGGLAVSGVVMQSVLRNPLASSSTLGVSSGAAVGASLVLVTGIHFLGFFTAPVFGFVFGLAAVLAAIGIAGKLSKGLDNSAIILTGMAFSFFAGSVITMMMILKRHELQRLVFWQMGSFALKDAVFPLMLFPVVLVGTLVVFRYAREMDMMTLGEEQALSTGVELKKVKWALLVTGSVITGAVVSMSGIIGFIDLFTPHVARKIFGASHRYVIVSSALLGGFFMVICDLVARAASRYELPVGAVTSFIGAPFFMYLYFSGKKEKK